MLLSFVLPLPVLTTHRPLSSYSSLLPLRIPFNFSFRPGRVCVELILTAFSDPHRSIIYACVCWFLYFAPSNVFPKSFVHSHRSSVFWSSVTCSFLINDKHNKTGGFFPRDQKEFKGKTTNLRRQLFHIECHART